MGENFRKFSKSAPTLTIVPMKRGVGVVTTKCGCGPFALLWERIRTSYCVKIYYFVVRTILSSLKVIGRSTIVLDEEHENKPIKTM